MSLTYEDVARILAVLDAAEGSGLDCTVGRWRIEVTGWGADAPESARIPDAAGLQRTEYSRDAGPRPGERSPGAVDDAPVEVRAPRPGFFRRDAGAQSLGSALVQDTPLGAIAGHGGQAAPVTAPADGRLVELCVEDGEFVQYAQVIAVLEPAPATANPRPGGSG